MGKNRPPSKRTECGLGMIRSEIARGKLLRLVDKELAIVHDGWKLLATNHGITANRYWLFMHPIGGEKIRGDVWTVNIPSGNPPTWVGEGFDNLDDADDRFIALARTELRLPPRQRRRRRFKVEDD